MPRKNSGCVSISGDLYRRLRAECESRGFVLASVIDVLVWRAIDELERDDTKRAAVARSIRLAGPVSTPSSPATEVSVSFKAWNRMLRTRRRLFPKLSAVRANTKLVNAMLDKAGAP